MTTLIAYRTPPQMELKAAKEARNAGHRAYVPTEAAGTRRVPTARGYLFAAGKPHDAKHIKGAIGTVARHELRGLYVRTSKSKIKHTYKTGDQVQIKRGHATTVPGVVLGVFGAGWYEVGIDMFGRRCRIKLREPDIAKG